MEPWRFGWWLDNVIIPCVLGYSLGVLVTSIGEALGWW